MNIQSASRAETRPFAFGAPTVDQRLRDGLARAALHDIYADGDDGAAAMGFALIIALLATAGRPIIVIRDERCVRDLGRLYGDGLAELGLDPAVVIVVHAADTLAALRAAADAVTCPDLGAVLFQPWRKSPEFNLTASRRLAQRARNSGVLTLAVRVGVDPVPSAATTRWRVRASPSVALAANAPGHPAFDLNLLHHRGGITGFDARVEWNRDQLSFGDAPLSRSIPTVAVGRARDTGRRRAA